MPASSMCSITAGTKTCSPSRDGVRLALDGVVQEAVDQDGPVGRDAHGSLPCNRSALSLVIDHLHAAAAQHIGGAHHDRDSRCARRSARASSTLTAMPDSGMGISSFSIMARNRSRSSARSMVSGEVPRIRTPAASSAGRGQVERGLPAELGDDARPASPSHGWLSTSSRVRGSK